MTKRGIMLLISSDYSPQRYRIKAQPYRTAPSCASPAPSVFSRKQAFTCSVYRSVSVSVHRAAFRASRSCLIGARKADLRQWTKGTFLRTVPGSYFCWVIAESYFRLAHSASAPVHTPAQPDHKRQPMRCYPMRCVLSRLRCPVRFRSARH